MQINHITINRNNITKENINLQKYSYDSIINNNINNTSEKTIESLVSVLFDIYNSTGKELENEAEKVG